MQVRAGIINLWRMEWRPIQFHYSASAYHATLMLDEVSVFATVLAMIFPSLYEDNLALGLIP